MVLGDAHIPQSLGTRGNQEGWPSWVEYRSGGTGGPHPGVDIFPDLSPRAKPYCGVKCSQGLHFLATPLMKLNKYLFNTVNNKELGRGQRSVIWLKCGQSCLHQLHVLSTVFSWWPFSSFSLWIILLPSDSCQRLAMVVCLAVSSAISWFEISTTAFLRFFSPKMDRPCFCVHFPSSQAAHELSDQAVQRA